MSMTTLIRRAAPRAAAPAAPTVTVEPAEDVLWAPVADFTINGLAADSGDQFETWAVARRAGSAWTPILGTAGVAAVLGTEISYDDTICSIVHRDEHAVMIGDLRRRRDPAIRTISEQWSLRSYIGAPLLAPDGTSLGSLCGFSGTPNADDERLRARVTRHASFLGTALSRELDRTRDQRLQDWAELSGTRDALTRLPDRRAWGQLLQREEVRGRALAEPVAITLVDTGAVGSTRALRRIAQALTEAAGRESAVARTGPRQFAVLSSGPSTETPAAAADRFVKQLAGIAPEARAGRAVRHGQGSIADVWVQAETDLLIARRGSR